jgi:type I restriction enzyme R subunit
MKLSKTDEAALEACIERFLTGDVSTPTSNDSKVQEDAATYQAGKGVGYLCGQSSDFNAEFALDEAKFWQFLEATQADEFAKLHYKPDYQRQILERLHRKLFSFHRRLRFSNPQTVSVVFAPIFA